MNDLAEFLLARIAEDEADARESDLNRWRGHVFDVDVNGWFNPPRVLAECEAKRQVVAAYLNEKTRRDAYQSEDARAGEDEEQAIRRRSSAARTRGLEIALERLALPYADHPDFRPEWRLDTPEDRR